MSEPSIADERTSPAFSLVVGDTLFRLQQAVGLIPREGFGIGRRTALLVLVTWVPIVVWALATGRALGHAVAEPLFAHFGVHVRCLVAIPLLVLADATTHSTSSKLLPYFITSGLVGESTRARFIGVLQQVTRLRKRSLPWVILLVLVVVGAVWRPWQADLHEIKWATDTEAAPVFTAGFGGWWFLTVVRPVFAALLLAWLWRIVVLWILFWRVARLDLSIVPTHPDRVGGLAFLEKVPFAFAPVVLAISAVASSRLAHDVMYHDVALGTLKVPAAALVLACLLLVLGPLLAFAGPLAAAKRQALLEYGVLVGEHGRRVRRRWILREPVEDDGLLSAPELGPVADTTALYDAIRQMRPMPIGPVAIAAVVIPAIIPMLFVVAICIPVKDVLLQLVKVLL